MGIMLGTGVGFTPEGGFGLSGAISDGNSVVVTGSSFGTKPNGAAPLYICEMGEGATTIDALSRGSWAGNWNTGSKSITQTVVAPNRSHACEMLLDAGTTENMISEIFDMGAVTDTYMFSRYHVDADGTDMFATDSNYNLKPHRFIAPGGGSNNDVIYPSVVSIDRADGDPRIASSIPGQGTHYFREDSTALRDLFGLRKNEWITDEWQLHQGTVDTSDGTWHVWRGGVLHTHTPNGGSTFITRTSSDTALMQRFSFIQDETNSGAVHKVRGDFLFLDDSFCHIIISDESTWNAATASPESLSIREPQIPTAWADGEITFTIRRGVHGTFVGLNLYVVDSAGAAQKIGQFT